ncbi:SsgA family sporulation/cell division regulator [Amycolatopsis panacis]|uniref:SsgA family sporulation/cell division regulator n=1 Tax=Amycolatopsis panacis TaxID=2340917 RepID=A0A419I3M5_9PSEU|nr:SsgA family sporulation/cell division regulator [Amycolatopsis panacis]RJQ84766.1 SsgA family sporulation/cell division regulator [Amycolatopsis panacis]
MVTRMMTARLRSGAWEREPGLVAAAVPVRMRYRASDPWALALDFRSGAVWVSWLLARDLLVEALTLGAAGEGDVRIAAEGDTVELSLSSPDGSAVLVFGRGEVEHAVDDTEAVVPAGMEGSHVDWDREVRYLGRDAA